MTYEQAVAYIDDIPKFTKKNTLDNTRILMERLGNPDRSMKILHVAGTNGKGSVCAYLSSVLTCAGKGTGLFTSPHLVKINERFIINQQEISDEVFLDAFHHVMDIIKEAEKDGFFHPTYFEMLFLIGMVIFADAKVEYLILETGLGGRKDATNVVQQPLISIITSIGIDHVEYLGDTYEAIAGEKAGIIKSNVPVVYDANRADVSAVMEKRAEESGSRTYPVDSGMYKIRSASYKNIDFCISTEYYETINLEISSVAEYQVMNAALAVTALKVIAEETGLTDEMIRTGISQMKWQGRMETVLPGVIVDGAHNEPGVAQFVKTVQRFQKDYEITYVFAAVNDKDYEKMIRTICEETDFRKVIVTEVNSYRRTPAKELADIFRRYTNKPVLICEDSSEAFSLGIQEKGDGLLFCVGSLYLVGDLKSFLRRNEND
ncbi:MAG: bifunctional folylpolyglutamate synthase/dihydrofolate synthase [Lachnospiraceae bacterium]